MQCSRTKSCATKVLLSHNLSLTARVTRKPHNPFFSQMSSHSLFLQQDLFQMNKGKNKQDHNSVLLMTQVKQQDVCTCNICVHIYVLVCVHVYIYFSFYSFLTEIISAVSKEYLQWHPRMIIFQTKSSKGQPSAIPNSTQLWLCHHLGKGEGFFSKTYGNSSLFYHIAVLFWSERSLVERDSIFY